ncbi:CDP-alcohol phosphatidyltransferase family protein [Wohlfahrtiimonas populi]|uniref:CDP-alcohol phosphatidyltransferase family protein n=1 Tax=Wohlfahrtiimonas populi TaxID=1940240 RepID=UPI00098D0C9E|nr:CDP-alcohol phosphatidyltransferase family protein [Wohlfahrtiimonas populi]
MISIYKLKPAFQSLLRPMVKKLYDAKITANQVTVAACVGSLIIAAIMAFFLPNTLVLWLMPIWMFVRMALNAIDGMLAREFNQQSKLGAYLNELCDVIADSALLAVFIFIAGINGYAVLLIIFLAFLSEYAGVMAPLIGASRRYDGPMGKSDRAFVFGTLSVVIALNLIDIYWINIVLYIVIALLIYTIFNRIRQGIRETQSSQE